MGDALEECELANAGAPITFFEITTAAALLAFSRHPADALILEVGLGGRLDATNVIRPARSHGDHARRHSTIRNFSAANWPDIAAEKAGIIKSGVPVIVAPQEDVPRDVIERTADALAAPVYRVRPGFFRPGGTRAAWSIRMKSGLLDLPLPRLARRDTRSKIRRIAIAALRHARRNWGREPAIEQGLRRVEWPARLQRLTRGPLVDLAPKDAEVWLDGGHNPHAAHAIARSLGGFRGTLRKAALSHLRNAEDQRRRGLLRRPSVGSRARSLRSPFRAKRPAGAQANSTIARARGLEASPADDLEDAMMQVSGLVARAARRRATAHPDLRIVASGGRGVGGERIEKPGRAEIDQNAFSPLKLPIGLYWQTR